MKNCEFFIRNLLPFFSVFSQNIMEFYSKLIKERFRQFLDNYMNFSQKPPTFSTTRSKTSFFEKIAKNAIFSLQMVTYFHMRSFKKYKNYIKWKYYAIAVFWASFKFSDGKKQKPPMFEKCKKQPIFGHF